MHESPSRYRDLEDDKSLDMGARSVRYVAVCSDKSRTLMAKTARVRIVIYRHLAHCLLVVYGVWTSCFHISIIHEHNSRGLAVRELYRSTSNRV